MASKIFHRSDRTKNPYGFTYRFKGKTYTEWFPDIDSAHYRRTQIEREIQAFKQDGTPPVTIPPIRKGQGKPHIPTFTPDLDDPYPSPYDQDMETRPTEADPETKPYTSPDVFWQIFRKAKLSEGVEESSIQTWSHTWSPMCRFLKPRQMNHITVEALQEWRTHLDNEGLKTRTFNNQIKALRTILNWAVENDFMDSNPANKLKTKRMVIQQNYKYLSHAQVKILLDIAQDYDRDIYLFMCIGFMMGFRPKEINHCRWEWIDWKNGCMVVDTMPQYKFNTKSKYSRIVKMTDELIQRLQPYKKDSGFIIAPLVESWQTKRRFSYRIKFDKVCELAGMTNVTNYGHTFRMTPYVMRHTYISLLIQEGVDPYVVANQAGHSDLKIQKVYAHMNPHKIEIPLTFDSAHK